MAASTIHTVDFHTHIGLKSFLARSIPAEKLVKPAFRDSLENTYQTLIAHMEQNSLHQAVIFAFPLAEIDPQRSNAYVLEAAYTYPERLIPFALVGNDADHWLKRGIKGFKQHNILQDLKQINLKHVYNTIAEAGVPLLVHLRSSQEREAIMDAMQILSYAPQLKMIIAHMGRGTPNSAQYVSLNLEALKHYPNIFFETSTVRQPRAILQAIEILGNDRVLFGSDFPFNSYQDADPIATEIATIRQTGLLESTLQKVFGLNALSCLGLPMPTL